jgi:hypothetical protein
MVFDGRLGAPKIKLTSNGAVAMRAVEPMTFGARISAGGLDILHEQQAIVGDIRGLRYI